MKIKNNDIIEILVDRKKGTLSFSINNVSYGIAANNIPKDENLYPVINMYEENQSVELLY